jgi:hypothetical protein
VIGGVLCQTHNQLIGNRSSSRGSTLLGEADASWTTLPPRLPRGHSNRPSNRDEQPTALYEDHPMLSRHTRKDDALDRLSEGIAQLTSSEAWRAWLRAQARFHGYRV